MLRKKIKFIFLENIILSFFITLDHAADVPALLTVLTLSVRGPPAYVAFPVEGAKKQAGEDHDLGRNSIALSPTFS